ncbi:MAG: leucine-rich repeat protein [Treponema sp.]|nr:leucine-rich repeat protein [Treponema sp.]MCL2191287.1 leucine-rich repeat protein [Treponema sp.]
MALIKCGYCGKEISDKARVCQGCGYPIDSSPAQTPAAKGEGTSSVSGGNILAEMEAERRTEIRPIDLNEKFEYTEKNGNITITKYTGEAKDVVIPGSINNFPVIAIGERAFASSQLTSVVIPDSVISIGESAFRDNQLTGVNISNSVAVIGGWSFMNNQLIDIVIPDSVAVIEDGTFANNRLISVTIPDAVTRIGNGSFYGNQLTYVAIPSSVICIGGDAFDSKVKITRQ